MAVIEGVAREKNALLQKVAQASRLQIAAETAALPLIGEHQQLNAALALATVGILQKQMPVSDEQIHTGLANVHWPGRLQLVTRASGRKILLDGAHNPAGAETLSETLQKNFPTERPTLILGVLQDKDWQHICETLAPLAATHFYRSGIQRTFGKP